MFRASFNGHTSTVSILLNAGGDPTLRQVGKEGGDGPYDVAKNEEIREILDAWDQVR